MDRYDELLAALRAEAGDYSVAVARWRAWAIAGPRLRSLLGEMAGGRSGLSTPADFAISFERWATCVIPSAVELLVLTEVAGMGTREVAKAMQTSRWMVREKLDQLRHSYDGRRAEDVSPDRSCSYP